MAFTDLHEFLAEEFGLEETTWERSEPEFNRRRQRLLDKEAENRADPFWLKKHKMWARKGQENYYQKNRDRRRKAQLEYQNRPENKDRLRAYHKEYAKLWRLRQKELKANEPTRQVQAEPQPKRGRGRPRLPPGTPKQPYRRTQITDGRKVRTTE
jgi:hypothetical protein